MIATLPYCIISNDPDNFRMKHLATSESYKAFRYLNIAHDTFQETLNVSTNRNFKLSNIHLEIFSLDDSKEDIYSESMVYHVTDNFIKIHLYLYSNTNRMLCQSTAHYSMNTVQ